VDGADAAGQQRFIPRPTIPYRYIAQRCFGEPSVP
jgi:hypothetical protein